ncbi:hypothetical protein [Kitasatospora sp. NBC_00458]|uniref:hypothetical protein n=1 Tax=Kitasatospora sp. NBC_00458 TaxID=2903568 RepID=UPI002E19CD90
MDMNGNTGAVDAEVGAAVEAEAVAVEKVVATVRYARLGEPREGFTGLFRADTIWTTARGRFLVGRGEAAGLTRRVLPGAFGGAGRTAVCEAVRTPAPAAPRPRPAGAARRRPAGRPATTAPRCR